MEAYSYISHLHCLSCDTSYEIFSINERCSCGGPLFVEYDYSEIKKHVTPDMLRARPSTLWRYHEMLPVMSPGNVVSLDENITPILKLSKYGKRCNFDTLFIKDEGRLPTGTFKARGATVGISKAKELGIDTIAISSNGNAGAAWAVYAARAGIKAIVATPQNAPNAPKAECVLSGADLYCIDGTIDDAGVFLQKSCANQNFYNVSTFNEPYRLEGKKTMGLEIAEQFSWSLPDVIVYPTGGGAGIVGIYKAFSELNKLGWVTKKLPRLVVVQASGCAPIVQAFLQGEKSTVPWEKPNTVAFGMRVPKPFGDFLILDLLDRTQGIAISVTDEDIQETISLSMQDEGVHLCPEGAAALAGVRQLCETGWINEGENVLVVNTGSGLKYIN
ncbi:threonine synthase [Alicyclobacillus fodiniaquatilis]|uniref:Threonine synthase n=1 Tax=Alicyclobacillus fodiniaquatilis TaxID=1661150 RepID=A0ABW4JKF6_9BACL